MTVTNALGSAFDMVGEIAKAAKVDPAVRLAVLETKTPGKHARQLRAIGRERRHVLLKAGRKRAAAGMRKGAARDRLHDEADVLEGQGRDLLLAAAQLVSMDEIERYEALRELLGGD